MYKINEIAKLSGITVRTLHYYDEIGLLVPQKVSDTGYRLYSDIDIQTLQQILFFRELDFPLSQIKEIMLSKNFNKTLALNNQMKLLTKKRERLDNLINLLNNAIRGDNNMSFKEFNNDELESMKNKYANEVKQRWGDTVAYNQSQAKTSSYTNDQWQQVNEDGTLILKDFAKLVGSDPASEQAQNLVKKWQNHITQSYYDCTKEILSCLGLMYVNDERFTQNIDSNGVGTAEFLSKSIEIYCSK